MGHALLLEGRLQLLLLQLLLQHRPVLQQEVLQQGPPSRRRGYAVLQQQGIHLR